MLVAILAVIAVVVLVVRANKKPKVSTITIIPKPELLTAQAVMDSVVKKYYKTQNTQEFHANFNQWLKQVMEKFDNYEVAYLTKRTFRQPNLPLDPKLIPCFNQLHANYGAYIIAYEYELGKN
jgi:hypothetical protein